MYCMLTLPKRFITQVFVQIRFGVQRNGHWNCNSGSDIPPTSQRLNNYRFRWLLHWVGEDWRQMAHYACWELTLRCLFSFVEQWTHSFSTLFCPYHSEVVWRVRCCRGCIVFVATTQNAFCSTLEKKLLRTLINAAASSYGVAASR